MQGKKVHSQEFDAGHICEYRDKLCSGKNMVVFVKNLFLLSL
jgi:hypothetical protein